jgi:hypothetical protein
VADWIRLPRHRVEDAIDGLGAPVANGTAPGIEVDDALGLEFRQVSVDQLYRELFTIQRLDAIDSGVPAWQHIGAIFGGVPPRQLGNEVLEGRDTRLPAEVLDRPAAKMMREDIEDVVERVWIHAIEWSDRAIKGRVFH